MGSHEALHKNIRDIKQVIIYDDGGGDDDDIDD